MKKFLSNKTDRFDSKIQFEQNSLSEKLQIIIEKIPKEKLTLLEIRNLLGREGMLLLIPLLSIVFLIPVSIPGVSTIFGGTILLIGVSLLLERTLWLPSQFLQKELPAKKLHNGFIVGLQWCVNLEKVSKYKRLELVTKGKVASIFNGLSIILASLLLMVPFGFIPFSNTFPAIALIFYSIGILQKDGVSVLLGHLFNIITLVYFAILISGGGYAIYELIQYVN